MSYSLVGSKWTPLQFDAYVAKLDTSWASSVTIHYTGYPDLAMRKAGLIVQHIRNIMSFYKSKGWSRGPHLFTDDVDINGMSPLTERGIHAKSFNNTSIGIEVLGNYDKDEPFTGRGLACWQIAAKTTASILKSKGLEPTSTTIKFHRDDPRTNKSCPGTKVKKSWFIEMVKAEMRTSSPAILIPESEANPELKAIQWQTSQILKEVGDYISEDTANELQHRLDSIEWQAKQLSNLTLKT